MTNHDFTTWCNRATSLIRFGPDRDAVRQELQAHLDDRYEDLLSQGFSEEEASEKTLEAMGDARDIAMDLALLHRPFWAYVLKYSRIFLIVVLCISLIPINLYIRNIRYEEALQTDFDVFDADSYGGDTGRTLLHLSQPDASFTVDGNTFRATDVALYTSDSEYYGEDSAFLHIRIRRSSWIPTSAYMKYNHRLGIGLGFYVVDSLGNRYNFYVHDDHGYGATANRAKSGIFGCDMSLWINGFQGRDADWIDICYDRDGRSESMRIYLTGGVEE